MLGTSRLVAFAATTNFVVARDFYRDKLGLTLVSETPFAFEFESPGRMSLSVDVVYVTDGVAITMAWPGTASNTAGSPGQMVIGPGSTTSASTAVPIMMALNVVVIPHAVTEQL